MLPEGVTFLCTVYNKAKYLPYVIRALSNQTGSFDREYLFIDDGSTDGSVAIIKQHTSGWPNVIILVQSNQGPAVAINNALPHVRYRHIKFVDTDDLLAPNATEVLLTIMQKHKTELSFGLHGNYTALDFEPPPVHADSIIIRDPVSIALRGKISGIHCGAASNGMVETEAFRAVGGCDPRVMVQDLSATLRMGLRGPFAFVPHPVNYRPASDPNRMSTNKAQEYYDTILTLHHFLGDNPGLAKSYARLAHRRMLSRAWRFAKAQHTASRHHLALRYLLSSLYDQPIAIHPLLRLFDGHKVRTLTR